MVRLFQVIVTKLIELNMRRKDRITMIFFQLLEIQRRICHITVCEIIRSLS